MKVTKAVITAAAENQRTLPLQTVVDRDSEEKPVLKILVEEALRAGIDDICVVVFPGDESVYRSAVAEHSRLLHFIPQNGPRGYGRAITCARDFVQDQPFLHLVGDHLYGSRGQKSCAQRLVETAEAERCSVSAVQPTRERDLPRFGTVAGTPVAAHPDLYRVETVVEKPTPTEAEETLIVPGLRSGYYLGFFGMHVLTPAIFGLLERSFTDAGRESLSPALQQLAREERYLALIHHERRYDVGAKYGLLSAQLALALNGQDRDRVLTQLLELLAQREMEEPHR